MRSLGSWPKNLTFLSRSESGVASTALRAWSKDFFSASTTFGFSVTVFSMSRLKPSGILAPRNVVRK